MGITRMTREHLGLAIALRIPVIVVITKIDIAPKEVLKSNTDAIVKLLKSGGVRKTPYFVKSQADVVTAIKGLANERFTPIFQVSNVKGDGLDFVRQFLNLVPPRTQWGDSSDAATEVIVDESYFVTGVGTVIGGTVTNGKLKAGETMLLGPDGNGQFRPVVIKSIHNRRQPVKEVRAGKSAGFAVKKVKRNAVRKGMVLVAPSVSFFFFFFFLFFSFFFLSFFFLSFFLFINLSACPSRICVSLYFYYIFFLNYFLFPGETQSLLVFYSSYCRFVSLNNNPTKLPTRCPMCNNQTKRIHRLYDFLFSPSPFALLSLPFLPLTLPSSHRQLRNFENR